MRIITFDLLFSFFLNVYCINRFYILNELLWQDALLIDFLQKKITNKWIQKFLVSASYLFNERVVFDFSVRFFLDFFLWPCHKLFIFEIFNISNLLTVLLFLFIVLSNFLFFTYIYCLLF